MPVITIEINIPPPQSARYHAAVAAEFDPSGTSGLTSEQLIKRYIVTQIVEVVDRHERKQAEASARASLPPKIDIT